MPAKVIITALCGDIQGTRYRFDEQMLCIIGRADNCTLQLLNEGAEGVSRHHCMLELNPPYAFIRDLGSRNGTFLNGRNIGRTSDSADSAPLELYALSEGDVFTVGVNSFRVSLIPALKCRICNVLLPDDYCDPETDDFNCIRCPRCISERLTQPLQSASKTLKMEKCSVCGLDIPVLNGKLAAHERYICPDCRRFAENPSATFKIESPQLQSNLLPIPGYRVLKRIGRGGMGVVYLAQDNDTLEKVAVKTLLPDIAASEECRQDFLREAHNLMPLKHPNIVELKKCDYAGGTFFIVLEYCSGGTLREYIRRTQKPLDLRTGLDLTYQILDALDYAHNVLLTQFSEEEMRDREVCGLVHRDIKPENVFIKEVDGILSAKIADFGLSKVFDFAGMSGCTRTGDFSGTLGFIPKQQFLNFKYAKPEVDVWASAATFYFMMSGAAPRDFSSGDIIDIFEEVPVPLRELNDDVPPAVSLVISEALDDKLTLKFKSAAALRFALEDAEKRS